MSHLGRSLVSVRVSERLDQQLEASAGALRLIVGALDVDVLSGDEAERLARSFAVIERLAAAGKALAAGRAAGCGVWKRSGERSAADWLARLSGTTKGQAQRTLDTAGRVADQPEVAVALRAGRLSWQQAEEIAAAAADVPERSAELVDAAGRETMRGLRDVCRRARAGCAGDAEEERARYRRIHDGRYLRSWVDSDGAGRFEARLTPDAYATVCSALAPFEDRVFDQARRSGRRASFEAYGADALVAMARHASSTAGDARLRAAAPVASDPPDGDPPDGDPPGGDPPGVPPDVGGPPPAGGDPPDGDPPGGDRPGGDPTGGGGVGPPVTVIVRVDHSALVRGYVMPGEVCEIDGVGPIPAVTARAMAADAFLAAVVTDGVDIRSVAHLGRSPTSAQRTALCVRDPVCVVSGCAVSAGLEIDHVDPWALTHVTRLDGLARLCRHHHQLKTYHGWFLTGGPGCWQLEAPRSDTSTPDQQARRRRPPPPASSPPVVRADGPFDPGPEPFPP